MLREFLLKHLQSDIAPLPQFAYTKQRGTADALFRVHAHFDEVVHLLAQNVVNRFQKQQGKKAARCLGGCSLSLDLSKAFDGVSRPMVYDTLAQHGVPSEVINAIQQLHLHSVYKYAVGTQVGALRPQMALNRDVDSLLSFGHTLPWRIFIGSSLFGACSGFSRHLRYSLMTFGVAGS